MTLQGTPHVCLLLLLSLLALAVCLPAGAAALRYPDLVHRLVDLERLALLPEPGEQGGLISSCARDSRGIPLHGQDFVLEDANKDGEGYVRKEGDRFVLGELEGPGCIWRIWTAAPGGGRIKLYLDGSPTPAVDLPFSGYFDRKNEPFTLPALVYQTPSGDFQGGSNCHVPIPFQRSCKIVADPGWGLYYHFSYTRFPQGTTVPTFSRDLDEGSRDALRKVNDLLLNRVGRDPAGRRRGQRTITRQVTVPPGQVLSVVELPGSGAVTALKVRFGEMDREEQMRVLRELTLRLSWDGEERPSVWSPLGDFFGTGPGANPYRSLPLGMTEGEGYCYWYMPFGEGARLEIGNDGASPRRLRVSVTVAPLSRPIETLGRFHAKWHRDPEAPPDPARPIDWPLAQVTGRGRFCGAALNVWNPRGLWWGEGDEVFTVDGEAVPSTFGTGSEDYFGYAWGVPKSFSRPFHAQTLVTNNIGHVSVARWQIAENVPFQRSFDGVIEKYNKNDTPVLYSAVAYWYLAPGGRDPYGEVPVEDRVDYYTPAQVHRVEGAIEAELLPNPKASVGFTGYNDLSWWSRDSFSNDACLFWNRAEEGERLELELPVAAEGDYDLRIAFAKDRQSAVVQCALDGREVGDRLDLFNADWTVMSGEISLGRHHLKAGQHRLTITIAGANEKAAKPLAVGVDYIALR